MIVDRKGTVLLDDSSDLREPDFPQREIDFPQREPDIAPPAYSDATVAEPSTSDGDNPVNGLIVATGYENINGTWRLDPFAPPSTPSLMTAIVSATNDRRGARRPRDGAFSAALASPTASFSSQYGSIKARLAVVGNPAHPARAAVKVASRHSNINVDLFEKTASKFVDLDVYTGRGDVLVMIPRSYSGVINLSSRHGHASVLPYLSTTVRVVKATSGEVAIIVGDGGQPEAAGPSTQLADHLHIHSRHGNVMVGFSGEDEYSPPDGKLAMVKRMLSQKLVKT
ncbi:hypothetical protein FA95DRAFT_1557802 [Auriscalpium vulgare]|uniref:Uncharacterized protein n=1 Tax=Auriscalpium vulgare TaxID=40419 RepID=A0ACB8RWG7_9AGAM|nr:hypothetical protein FA95DRAFT_1557802 [Auriscalpium vulgare]